METNGIMKEQQTSYPILQTTLDTKLELSAIQLKEREKWAIKVFTHFCWKFFNFSQLNYRPTLIWPYLHISLGFSLMTQHYN